MATRIVILTRAWPYPPGEQFVSLEAPHWVREGVEVVVMPWWASGTPTAVPTGVRVDLSLARRTRPDDLRAIAAASLQPAVRAEVAELVGGRPSKAQLADLVRTARGALFARDQLRGWIARNGPIDLVYSYWFDSWTLGALLLKGRGVGHVATRVHGYDLYEDRRPTGRLPLRSALANRLDLLLPVARSGGAHAVANQGIDPAIVRHSPLGVALPDQLAVPSPDGQLQLLSVASCLPVKRVDRLVDAVGLLAEAHPELVVGWTHLGGGQLLDELRAAAQTTAARHPNLTIDFAGQVDPRQVAEHLATRPVDLFCNTSESEGVPVSIMEAMAAGVPALAPAVGAVDEVVSPGTGVLLDPEPTPQQIADALWAWRERAKDPVTRHAAREQIAEHYDQQRNHSALMDDLVKLARS